jgi:hypothetical protein
VALKVHPRHLHRQTPPSIESGVRWAWTDGEAERRDAEARAALARLAAARRAGPGDSGR